jgi:DNA-binding NtrC family response regulator
LLVGQVSLQAGIVAMRKGAFDCFTKPVDHHDLLKAIERAAARANQASQDGMIGDCDVMLKLKKQISRVAPLDTTILVGGESGTGKELVAQAIHRQSQRADREMLSVNCAAIPESLIEAELFGHVKGAFTGATSDRAGLIESADQSTLFLDEIGELPLEAQSRLLRVLQEGEIRRVGSTERTYVDVRLIAATHRNLLEMVSKGQFREDLYYRLNVIELRCPPLRERGEDVILLAEFFLNAIQTQMARPELRFSQDAQQAIQQHHWPGNVRELANVIERAVVLCEGPLIDALDLSLQSHGSNPPQFSAGEQRRPSENRPMMSLEDYFQHFVLSHEEHMSETELAKRLGISRKSLWERRNRLGIPRRKDEGSD